MRKLREGLWSMRWLCWAMPPEAAAVAAVSHIAYISSAESQTLTVGVLDGRTGAWSVRQTLALGGTVMPLALSPDRRFLFAALRSEPYRVASFAIDPATGELRAIGEFALPHSMSSIATDRTGRLLLASSYGGDLLSVSRIDRDGHVAPAHQIITATPKAHAFVASPDNRFALATSLGDDTIRQMRLDATSALVSDNTPQRVALPAQCGPRHLVFHPAGRFVYLINELDASVLAFAYDAESGCLELIQRTTALPDGFVGQPSGADAHASPDGRHLYVSERGSNTLVAFRIDACSGMLQRVGHYPTEAHPRGFNIDPSGQFLLALGLKSSAMSIYRIGAEGALSLLERHPLGAGPNWVEFVTLPARQP